MTWCRSVELACLVGLAVSSFSSVLDTGAKCLRSVRSVHSVQFTDSSGPDCSIAYIHWTHMERWVKKKWKGETTLACFCPFLWPVPTLPSVVQVWNLFQISRWVFRTPISFHILCLVEDSVTKAGNDATSHCISSGGHAVPSSIRVMRGSIYSGILRAAIYWWMRQASSENASSRVTF